jgi:hypothetical protein
MAAPVHFKPFMWITRKDDCGTLKGEPDMAIGLIIFASIQIKITMNVATVSFVSHSNYDFLSLCIFRSPAADWCKPTRRTNEVSLTADFGCGTRPYNY